MSMQRSIGSSNSNIKINRVNGARARYMERGRERRGS